MYLLSLGFNLFETHTKSDALEASWLSPVVNALAEINAKRKAPEAGRQSHVAIEMEDKLAKSEAL